MKSIQLLKLGGFTLLWTMFVSCGLPSDTENNDTATDAKGSETTVPDDGKFKGTKIEIETSMGKIVVGLYDNTPKHRDNFIKLVKEKFYDGVLFHRVIKDFMIQTGDPNSVDAAAGVQLGNGGPGYTIDAEINTENYHKKGALSAARQGDQVNPEKKSSGSQFYIVTGKIASEAELVQMAERVNSQNENASIGKFIQDPENIAWMQKLQGFQQTMQTDPSSRQAMNDSIQALAEAIKPLAMGKDYKSFEYSAEMIKEYTTNGGTPFLDGGYTVFGEVLEGLEIADKIGLVATAPGDRPTEDVKIISMKVK